MKENDTLKDKDTFERDTLFEEGVKILINFKESNNLIDRRSVEVLKTSLQKALCVGYNRAHKIIMQLSDAGYIELPKGWKIKEDKGNEIHKRQVYNPQIYETEFSRIDPLFEDAVRLIIKKNSASTSNIQRTFVIGYNRAYKIMEQLEKAGIIGPAIGIKPREILMDKESLEKFLHEFNNKNQD